jgi:tRNA uridine 5-carbamoylmethylation protein Kti12
LLAGPLLPIVIVLVCGPPAAGKTTIAARARERLAADGRPFRLLHSDEYSRRTYEQLSATVAEDPDADWIVDGTFYRREWRDRFRDLGDVRVVHVTASLATCLARNRDRAESIDEQGVHVVYREFDRIEPALTIDTDELTVEQATDRLVGAIQRWN